MGRLVLVINRGWTPVHVTTVRRAICMVFQGTAYAVGADTLQVHNFDDWVCGDHSESAAWIVTPSLPIPVPEVIQLRTYAKVPSYEAPFTRRNLYQRDDYTCQYCARRYGSDLLSIDHILPRSRGGRTSWENCVLACRRCNARKADRTLQESGLALLNQPRRPAWSPYLNLDRRQRRGSWRRFTPQSQWDVFDRKATGS